MKKTFFKLFFLSIYLFTSSTIFHAWVMAHDMMSNFWHHDEQINPCHQDLKGFWSKPNGDCYEVCLWVYDDIGWVITLSIDDLYASHADYTELFWKISPATIKTPFCTKTDPPPPPLMWYWCIGKNVKKCE